MSLVYFSVVTHNTDCTDISCIHPPPQWSRRRRRRRVQKRWPRESRRAWPAQQGGRRRSRSLTRHRAGRHVRHCSGQSKKYIIHTGGLFGEKPGFSNWRQPAVIAESREYWKSSTKNIFLSVNNMFLFILEIRRQWVSMALELVHGNFLFLGEKFLLSFEYTYSSIS